MDFKIMFSEYMTVYLLEKSFRHKLADTGCWIDEIVIAHYAVSSIEHPFVLRPSHLNFLPK